MGGTAPNTELVFRGADGALTLDVGSGSTAFTLNDLGVTAYADFV